MGRWDVLGEMELLELCVAFNLPTDGTKADLAGRIDSRPISEHVRGAKATNKNATARDGRKCEDCQEKWRTFGFAADWRRRWCKGCSEAYKGQGEIVDIHNAHRSVRAGPEYEVEAVLQKRLDGNKPQVLVKWRGYPRSEFKVKWWG